MIESYILIAGLVLFSSTVTYDLHSKLVDAQNANNVNKTVQVEKTSTGFMNEDVKK